MLEYYYKAPHKLARFRSSPVGNHIDGFAATLRADGYGQGAATLCIRNVVHLGAWTENEGISVTSFDDGVIRTFEEHLPGCRCPGQSVGRYCYAVAHAKLFLAHLQRHGLVPKPSLSPSATPEMIANFCSWMRRQRGATDATVHVYRRVGTQLVGHLGNDPTQYNAHTLRAAVAALTAGLGNSTAKQVATVARAFMRYLSIEGTCRPGLAEAIPPVPNRRLQSLPRYVSAEDVKRIIDACEEDSLAGTRDRAILLLLARLGLRAGDIVGLRQSDLDWKRGCIRVAGKSRREVWLPLPQDVGDAVRTYLVGNRPAVTCDRLFLTARAPWRGLGNSSTVSGLVAHAIRRAGVSAPNCGAHLLRHSAATEMLRQGVSLPTIGVVLRHSSIETTSHYAKVDIELLRSVAQPWLEEETC